MTDTTDRTGADWSQTGEGTGDDAGAVGRRAMAFARELGAVGDVGWLLARRAATLAGRMEQLAERDGLMIRMNVQAARDAFDDERRAERARWAAALRGDDPRKIAEALANLELSPQGLDVLHRLWGKILDGVRSADPADVAGPAAQARRYLDAAGLGPPADAADLTAMVAAEVERLRRRDERTRGALEQVIEDARREVGVVASFDPSPEAGRARRQEAAAERGMYRAMKMILDLRHDAGLAPVAEADAGAPMPGPGPGPAPRPAAPPPARPAAPPAGDPPVTLGSFRVGLDLPPTWPGSPLGSFCIGAKPDRRRRPDLSRTRGKRR